MDQLARETLQCAASMPPGRQWIVAMAGPPGSGKTTTAQLMAARINELAAEQQLVAAEQQSKVRPSPFAVIVPMDGYHYYRHELDAMPNSEVRPASPLSLPPSLLLV